MPGRISDEDIEALRTRADIATVIADHTGLKRAGGRLKGLCPFHQEKTPSFTVDPQRNLFHCFGCGEGGDVYAFLQKAEALSFPEAVERLARIVGYELRYEQLSAGQRRALGKRTRLAQALGDAAAFYQEQLVGPEGAAAREYLAGRGIDRATAEHFALGWAPDQWDALTRHLLAKDYTVDELAEARLVSQGRHGPTDFFRGRVLFPIFDKAGRDVLGFGGRVLPDLTLQTWRRDDPPPKYINSSDSPVYRKTEVLYGLAQSRAEIQRRDQAIVVEGYMDVIGLHLAGLGNAVATCGTALTAEHLRTLEQFARRVVLALDADDAGYRAAERARALAAEAGLRELGVLPLPPGTDPADLAAGGRDAVEAALGRTKSAVEFQLEQVLRTAETDTAEGQVAAYRATFPLLASIEDRALRYTYIRDVVAPVVRLRADRIEDELDAEVARAAAEGIGGGAPGQPAGPGQLAGEPRDQQLRLERDVLQASLQVPELMPAEWDEVEAEDFRAPASQQLFSALRAAGGKNLDEVLAHLPDDGLRTRVRALALDDARVEPEPAKLAELVGRLRAAAVQRQIDAVRSRLGEINEQVDGETRQELSRQLFELELRRRALLQREVG